MCGPITRTSASTGKDSIFHMQWRPAQLELFPQVCPHVSQHDHKPMSLLAWCSFCFIPDRPWDFYLQGEKQSGVMPHPACCYSPYISSLQQFNPRHFFFFLILAPYWSGLKKKSIYWLKKNQLTIFTEKGTNVRCYCIISYYSLKSLDLLLKA